MAKTQTRGSQFRRPKRPPPRHQLTLDESIARLALSDITRRRMFGGLCYYAKGNPFSFLLGDALALKLPAERLRSGCANGDGEIFRPGGGEFVMREYLALSHQALTDADTVDEYVLASYRFLAGQEPAIEELSTSDLLEGRSHLYKQSRSRKA